MRITGIFILAGLILTGCDIPEVPARASCTLDGWQFNPTTGEILVDPGNGLAMACDLQ